MALVSQAFPFSGLSFKRRQSQAVLGISVWRACPFCMVLGSPQLLWPSHHLMTCQPEISFSTPASLSPAPPSVCRNCSTFSLERSLSLPELAFLLFCVRHLWMYFFGGQRLLPSVNVNVCKFLPSSHSSWEQRADFHAYRILFVMQVTLTLTCSVKWNFVLFSLMFVPGLEPNIFIVESYVF